MKDQIKEAARLRPVPPTVSKDTRLKKVYLPREYVSRMCLRITEEVIAAVKTEAKKEAVKTNQLIRFVLTEAFTQQIDIKPEQEPKNLVSHQFDMPLEMKAELEKRADALGINQSELVRELLKQYLRSKGDSPNQENS
jgi:hypothetical protein